MNRPIDRYEELLKAYSGEWNADELTDRARANMKTITDCATLIATEKIRNELFRDTGSGRGWLRRQNGISDMKEQIKNAADALKHLDAETLRMGTPFIYGRSYRDGAAVREFCMDMFGGMAEKVQIIIKKEGEEEKTKDE